MIVNDQSNILLIDDEMDYLVPLAKRMRKRDFKVFTVGNGFDALNILKDEPIDVVVLDIKMPGMDGNQVLKEIKDKFPLIEVIMLTGHADMDIALEVMEHGAFDYLTKPIDFDELIYKIQDALKKKKIMEAKIYHEREEKGEDISNL